MAPTGTMVRLVFGIIGSVVLLFAAAYIATIGFAFSVDAPHAWRGDMRIGVTCSLIATAITFGAIALFRRSVRRLRSLRETRLREREPRSATWIR